MLVCGGDADPVSAKRGRSANPSVRPDVEHVRLCPPERPLDLGEGEVSDQWALATIVAEVASGEPAVPGSEVADLSLEIREGRARAGWRARDQVPRAMRAALDPMRALDPDRRPSGARLALVLQALLDASLPAPDPASFVVAAPVVTGERLATSLSTSAVSKADVRVAAPADEDPVPEAPEVRRLVRESTGPAEPPILPRALRRLGR